ncbi:hypothetical protein EVAR_24363_1 [Eumeta japonica]|uniref:Uncharacterized protein n=1 Tax=Eumeta variegata TaxID=151549 RepID=A0A4C1YC94_EUMVA|nr:hypothetical protein EVAR_24363_1 [Eumeta japonica]
MIYFYYSFSSEDLLVAHLIPRSPRDYCETNSYHRLTAASSSKRLIVNRSYLDTFIITGNVNYSKTLVVFRLRGTLGSKRTLKSTRIVREAGPARHRSTGPHTLQLLTSRNNFEAACAAPVKTLYISEDSCGRIDCRILGSSPTQTEILDPSVMTIRHRNSDNARERRSNALFQPWTTGLWFG